MLVMSRRETESFIVRRRWRNIAHAPEGVIVVVLLAGHEVGEPGVVVEDRVFLACRKQRNIVSFDRVVGWQSMPQRDESIEVVNCELRGNRARIGVRAPQDFHILRSELIDGDNLLRIT